MLSDVLIGLGGIILALVMWFLFLATVGWGAEWAWEKITRWRIRRKRR
jgi:hypothetical protein